MKEFEKALQHSYKIITKTKAKEYNSLVFAFVGDSVHTLYVRTYLAHHSLAKAGALHKRASEFIKASGQAKVLDNLQSELSEEELQIVKTARNIKNKTVAKNANLEDYKKSTAFEALIGYLYLTEQVLRMKQLLEKSIQIMENL